MDEFRAAGLAIDFDAIVSPAERERWLALPDAAMVRDRTVPIDYDVEEGDGQRRGVARLRLPEKLARTLSEAELPALDRPIRFTVLRGPRGAVRASTLEELQDMLDRPWSPDEMPTAERPSDLTPADERRARELARDLRGNRSSRRGRHRSRDDDRDGARRGGPSRGPGRGPRPPGRGGRARRRRGR